MLLSGQTLQKISTNHPTSNLKLNFARFPPTQTTPTQTATQHVLSLDVMSATGVMTRLCCPSSDESLVERSGDGHLVTLILEYR